MACECGCGFEGEDEVTQFCIEEASLLAYDAAQAAAIEAETGQGESEEEAGPKPGQITDPAVAAAMAEAKRIHRETHGVQV